MLRSVASGSLLLLLGACATAAPPSGFLTSYERLQAREDGLRTALSEGKDAEALQTVRVVALEPTVLAPGAGDWMNEAERGVLLREMDAQLCFEVSERYQISNAGTPPPDGVVRAAVTAVRATGRVGSALSAAAGFFIPGPIGVRAPGTTGGLTVEAEMLSPDGRQLAALAWNRAATPVGTDTPSLSRIGDALQFAEPFADDAAKALSAPSNPARAVPQPDPCAAYGPRVRPAGFIAKLVTGLYVPQASGARVQPVASPAPAAPAAPAGPADAAP